MCTNRPKLQAPIELLQAWWHPVSLYFYIEGRSKPIKHAFSYLFQKNFIDCFDQKNKARINTLISDLQKDNKKIQRIVAVSNPATLRQLKQHIDTINRTLPAHQMYNFHSMLVSQTINKTRHKERLKQLLNKVKHVRQYAKLSSF